MSRRPATQTIWKYPVAIQDEIVIEVPEFHRPLCVQMQGVVPVLWMLVCPRDDQKTVKLHLHWFGTGEPVYDDLADGQYIGTVQQNGFVWHLFDDGYLVDGEWNTRVD